jgi:hypothetical protein
MTIVDETKGLVERVTFPDHDWRHVSNFSLGKRAALSFHEIVYRCARCGKSGTQIEIRKMGRSCYLGLVGLE